MNVDLRHLRAFIAVADAGNFTRAAEGLRISQPSLSYTIRQLESQLGVQLLNRTTHSTALTGAGEIFLAEARAVLDRHEQALNTAKRLAAGQVGRLRVGYLIGAAVDHVPTILRAFSNAYPDVDVELTEWDFSAPNCGLDSGRTDVAIARPPLNVPGLVTRTLLTEARFACVPESHPLADTSEVSLPLLLRERLVAAPGAGPWRDSWMLTDHRPPDAPVHVAYEAATFEAEMQAVALGKGVSVVPASATRLYARRGVRFLPITGVTNCEVCVAYTSSAPPSAANFAHLASQVAKESATATGPAAE